MRGRKSGVLHLTREGVSKRLYFRAGSIILAGSDLPEDRLGQALLRAGMIREADLERALGVVETTDRTIGETIVAMGLLRPEQVQAEAARRTKLIVESVLDWDTGEYAFEERDERLAGELLVPGRRAADPARGVPRGPKRRRGPPAARRREDGRASSGEAARDPGGAPAHAFRGVGSRAGRWRLLRRRDRSPVSDGQGRGAAVDLRAVPRGSLRGGPAADPSTATHALAGPSRRPARARTSGPHSRRSARTRAASGARRRLCLRASPTRWAGTSSRKRSAGARWGRCCWPATPRSTDRSR